MTADFPVLGARDLTFDAKPAEGNRVLVRIERQLAELAKIDAELDAKWQRIHELFHPDPTVAS
jgi:hypothetical protein